MFCDPGTGTPTSDGADTTRLVVNPLYRFIVIPSRAYFKQWLIIGFGAKKWVLLTFHGFGKKRVAYNRVFDKKKFRLSPAVSQLQ